MTFALREAIEADVAPLAALHVQTFNETHRGGQPTGPSFEIREYQWRERFQQHDGSWFCFVVEDASGSLVGFTMGAPHDNDLPAYEGGLNSIYVLQRMHRQGIGRRLLCAVASRLVSEGVNTMMLFGEASNPSNGFYEAFGAERILSERGEFHGAYGWRDLRALVERCKPQ